MPDSPLFDKNKNGMNSSQISFSGKKPYDDPHKSNKIRGNRKVGYRSPTVMDANTKTGG